MPDIYWVRRAGIGRLAVVQRPRTAADYPALKEAGIDVLVSMLEAGEATRAGIGAQADLCAAAGIEFHNLPIVDFGLPSAVEPIELLARTLISRLDSGLGVGAHCFAGLGRSPLMIATVMIETGMGAREACALLSTARGHSVPEMTSQTEWLAAYEARKADR